MKRSILVQKLNLDIMLFEDPYISFSRCSEECVIDFIQKYYSLKYEYIYFRIYILFESISKK